MQQMIHVKLALKDKGLEEVKLVSFNVVLNFYGFGQTYDFYRVKFKELLELIAPHCHQEITATFQEVDIGLLMQKLLTQKDYNGTIWAKVRESLTDVDLKRGSIAKIILLIANLDPRISLQLFYDLGLLEGINSDNEFASKFQIDELKIQLIRRTSIDKLINSIYNGELPVGHGRNRERFHAKLDELRNCNLNDFLRYCDNSLIPGDSEFYKLARILYFELPGYDFSVLSESELSIVESFRKDFATTRKFTRLKDREYDECEIKTILEKTKLPEYYVRASNGRLNIISFAKPRYELIRMYIDNNEILNNQDLTPIQKALLEYLLKPNEDGNYNTIPSAAELFQMHEPGIEYQLKESLIRIKNPHTPYVDNRGWETNHIKLRTQLLELHLDIAIRSQLDESELDLLDSIMERRGLLFVNSCRDISRRLNIYNYNIVQKRVKRLIKKILSLQEA